jgi:hypothetical protein
VRAGDYAARYGVDRYTAHEEMVMLEVPIAPDDQRFAVRPPPRPTARRPVPHPDQCPPAVIEWGGKLIFVIGCTSGGVPYGLQMEEIFTPAEIEMLRDDH